MRVQLSALWVLCAPNTSQRHSYAAGTRDPEYRYVNPARRPTIDAQASYPAAVAPIILPSVHQYQSFLHPSWFARPALWTATCTILLIHPYRLFICNYARAISAFESKMIWSVRLIHGICEHPYLRSLHRFVGRSVSIPNEMLLIGMIFVRVLLEN